MEPDGEDAARSTGSVDVGPRRAELEEFASTVTHELATPLAIVVCAAETALRRGADDLDQLRQLLETIRRNGEHAGELLRRIALVRDLSAGTAAPTPSPLDLCELVRATVEDLRLTGLRGHEVEVETPAPAMIEADASAIREILYNLLDNAAKYGTPGTPIRVSVGLEAHAVEVVVANHGSGVTPDDSERIFERYERIDTQAPGLGLGLFLSRELARAHGGDLVVRPASERGSEFRLTVPRTSS